MSVFIKNSKSHCFQLEVVVKELLQNLTVNGKCDVI